MTADLAVLMSRHRDTLLAGWHEAVARRYPGLADCRGGSAGLKQSLAVCLDIVGGADVPVPAGLADWLAVQDCPPEEAMVCVYLLKPLLRAHILPQLAEPAGYLEAESRVDSLALLLFGAYVRCRERVHQLRLAAVNREQTGLRRWAEAHGFFSERAR